MATINVIQATRGTITVSDTTESHYTVTYTPSTQESFFNGFKVYCHACGRYVFQAAAASQSVSINFTQLQNDGHPGPFDISANEHDVEFLVETASNDETMGTTSPVERIIGVDVGGSVSFTITATAKTGYMFIKWVSDTGTEWTSPSLSITVHVNSEVDNYRLYTAYFGRREYLSRCDFRFPFGPTSGYPQFRPGTVMTDEMSEYVVVRDKIGDTVTDVNVAIISKDSLRVARGGQVTFTVQMLPAAETYGVVFLGWVAGARSAEEGMGSLSSSISLTCTSTGSVDNNPVRVYAYFGIDTHTATVKFVRPEYYQPASLPTARSWDGVSSSSTSRGSPDVHNTATAEYSWYFQDGSLYIWWDGPTGPAEQLAVVHGTSSASCEVGEFTVPGANTPATIKITPDLSATSETFIVYLCTHALVCTDDGAHLECKPPELLYDCSVPTGTTVYP